MDSDQRDQAYGEIDDTLISHHPGQRGRDMENGYVAREYQKMSANYRRTFDRWLKANAFIGLIFAAGIIAMALAGFRSAGPNAAILAGAGKALGMVSDRPVSRSGLRKVRSTPE